MTAALFVLPPARDSQPPAAVTAPTAAATPRELSGASAPAFEAAPATRHPRATCPAFPALTPAGGVEVVDAGALRDGAREEWARAREGLVTQAQTRRPPPSKSGVFAIDVGALKSR